MSEYDVALDAPIVSEAKKLGLSREKAIEIGRMIGISEAAHRNEPKEWAESRIKRAMAYAAWDFDGRPVGKGAEYRKEFGVSEIGVSDPRVHRGSDFVAKRER